LSPPDADPAAERRFVIVTGMSGAGRTSCLKVLEDQGFEAIDNLPIPLIERFVRLEDGLERDLAIGLDSRTRAFDPKRLAALVGRLARVNPAVAVSLVFFDCDDEVLQQRFTETRRRHPLAADRPVQDGIAAERALLASLKAAADIVIDTTQLALPELKRLLVGYFGSPRKGQGLTINCISFAYRRGLPREADLVFDTRFLDNPHYVPQLKPLTGLDPAVQAHVQADPGYAGFEAGLWRLIEPLLPRYQAEGKSYLTIATGCTGGQHRSVFVTERLAQALRAAGYEVSTTHRELAARGGPAVAAPAGEAVGADDRSRPAAKGDR
jgi:RNase adapter protein RapZ